MLAAARAPHAAGSPEGFGSGPQAAGQSLGEPEVMSALMKSSTRQAPVRLGPAPHGRLALRKSATQAPPEDPGNDFLFEGDTSWFDYRDSARGTVNWVHVFRDPDNTVNALVVDTLIYRWPCLDSTPVLVGTSTSMRPYVGGEYHLVLSDEDGDGILNGASDGAPMRIRKEWRSVAGDTVRKSVWHLDHGNAELRANLDEGVPVSFSETTLVAGRAIAWSASRDGDGDGFVLRATSGHDLIVKTESFTLDATGNRWYTRLDNGDGADGDWTTAADNPWFRYGRTGVSPRGDTLEASQSGDADGDGYYYDPAPGARNLAWETHHYTSRKGYRTYRDSVVRELGDLADAGDDRVISGMARIEWPDGGISTIRSVRKGNGSGFGIGDTVSVRETRRFAAGSPNEGGLDSLEREAWILAGDLASPADDQLIWSNERAWHAAGGALITSVAERHAGVWEYTAALPGDRRAEGRYEPVTGRFQDRILYQEGKSTEVLTGQLAEDGTGEVSLTHFAGGASETVRLVATRAPGAFRIAAVSGIDTAWYTQAGDSTLCTLASPLRWTYLSAFADGAGGYRIFRADLDRDGAAVGQGEFGFSPDGSGSGWLQAGEAPSLRTRFRVLADGTVDSLRDYGIAENRVNL